MKKSEALNILGLADGATDDEIKAAHRTLVRANHPDKFAGDEAKKAAAENKMKSINEARDVLLNRSWKPEYGQGPRAYNPYAGATGSSQGGYRQGQGDPFDDFPFDFDFIWTNVGQPQGQGQQQSDGYNPFNPFSGFYTQRKPKTPQEQFAEAKESLKSTTITIAVKFLFALLFLVWGGMILGVFGVIIGFFLLMSLVTDIINWRILLQNYRTLKAVVGS